MSAETTEQRLHRLIDAGRALVAEVDLDAVLDRVLETGRQITGARYAALGILDERRRELERFLTKGIDEDARRAIGDLPRGRGILGVLIEDRRPLRLSSVGDDPRSYGFPAGHPPMNSFLGVPIQIRGKAWGNLYLTEKRGGVFDELDEEAAVILADWAAIAIEHARLHETAANRREELERAVRGFEATQTIAVAVGAETDLGRILELIVKRGRALVDARSVIIMLHEGHDLVVAAGAGHGDVAQGVRIPVSGSTSGEVMAAGRAERIADVGARLRIEPEKLGINDAQSALLVPLIYRGRQLGVLAAFDRTAEAEPFRDEDEQALRGFAASAATAVALAQSVQEDRLRHSLEATESERRRWARELHDETLQALGGLRVILSSALRHGDAASTETSLRQAIDQIEIEIANLRAIITELRPPALDELGLRPAIEALVARHRSTQALEIACELQLPAPESGDARLSPQLETTVYRLVQETLANVVKHADASHVSLTITTAEPDLAIDIRDDGRGFEPADATAGFGLIGMRERVTLEGGTFAVESSPDGTWVSAALPASRRPANPKSRERRSA